MLAVVAWNWVGIQGFLSGGPPGISMLVLVPVVVPALFMCFNLAAFPFRYSVFGPLVRSKAPDINPLKSFQGSWGRIGWCHASVPFVKYAIYSEGLAISIRGVGAAFLPMTLIESCESGFLRGNRLGHRSPEIRNPISVPRGVFNEVRMLWMQGRGRTVQA